MGQCSKIVHLKEPFNQYHMSTKKIFDDMYLYLREINRKHIDYVSSTTLGTKFDELNGMPVDSYAEFTSHFWNLIYKDPYKSEDDKTERTMGPDILAIDDDIASRKKKNSHYDFSKLSSDGMGGPNPVREAALNLVLEQSKKSVFKQRIKGLH